MAKISTKKGVSTHVKRGRPVTSSSSSPTTSNTVNCRLPAGPTSHGSNGKPKHRPIRPSTHRSPTVVIKRKSVDSNLAIRTFVSSRSKDPRYASSFGPPNSNTATPTNVKSSSSSGGSKSGEELLLKKLCLALSQATSQDRRQADARSTTQKECDRRSSASSISSTTSSSSGGQFGFLALGPLFYSRSTTTPPTEVQEDDSEEEEEEEARKEEDDEEESGEEESLLVMGYEPTIEDLEVIINSNPLDFEPEEFLPPFQLGEEDFLPLLTFDGMASTHDWQQRQQPQQKIMSVAPHLTPSPSPSPPSSLLSFSMMSPDATNVWDAQLSPLPTPSGGYECYPRTSEVAVEHYGSDATATTTVGPYYLIQSFPPSPLPTPTPISNLSLSASPYFQLHDHNDSASQQALLFQSMDPQAVVPAAVVPEFAPRYIPAVAPVTSSPMASGFMHHFSSPSPPYMHTELPYLRPYSVQLQTASMPTLDAFAEMGSSFSFGSCAMNQ